MVAGASRLSAMMMLIMPMAETHAEARPLIPKPSVAVSDMRMVMVMFLSGLKCGS